MLFSENHEGGNKARRTVGETLRSGGTPVYVLAGYAAVLSIVAIGASTRGGFLLAGFLAGATLAYMLRHRRALSVAVQTPNEIIERYELLTDNLAAAVMIRDADSKLLWCNPYAEPLTGYSRTEIVSTPGEFFAQICHPDDREILQRAVQYTAIGEPFQFRFRFYHRSGILMWAETRTVPVLDEHGEVSSSLSITFDVTRSVRQQAQVEEHNRDLQDFSYMLSHDLKSPLYTIRGMLNVVREEVAGSLSDEAREALQHMDKAISRVELLITGVLEYSRLGSGETAMGTVALRSVVDDVHLELRPQLDAIKATLTVQPDLPVVFGDALKFYQVFHNLLGNAVKYRDKSRPLELSVTAAPAAARGMVQIDVADNGSGIPAEKVGMVFRPFHRAHGPEIEGSGIGLASVKKLLERCGGSITVESTPGKGSTFKMLLRSAGAADGSTAVS